MGRENSKGMSGHQSAKMITDEWYTPPEIIKSLGEFDLDPCSPIVRPWDTAKQHYNKEQDGLILPWFGRVWVNPPYGSLMYKWIEKLSIHSDGIALIFARTETVAFQRYVFEIADSILFIKNRLHFYNQDGVRAKFNAGAPSVLIAYGERNVDALAYSGIEGKHVLINSIPIITIEVERTWKQVVSISLTRIGRVANMDEIYNTCEIISTKKCDKNKHYKEKIRQVLQKYFVRVEKGKYIKEETNGDM